MLFVMLCKIYAYPGKVNATMIGTSIAASGTSIACLMKKYFNVQILQVLRVAGCPTNARFKPHFRMLSRPRARLG